MASRPKAPKSNASPFGALTSLREQIGQEERVRAEAEKKRKQQEAKRAALLNREGDREGDEEADLFAQAMQGVRPIEPVAPRPRKPPPIQPPHLTANGLSEDDEEALRELEDIVAGRAPLDFTDSDEFVEGRAEDCSRLVLSRLRNGEFAVQGSVDLHGKNRDEARETVLSFFSEALARGHRCVNIICGRGLHTPGGKPVLKELLVRWLVQGRLSHNVLAFSSAKSHDGGVGAIYVLLRRKHPRA